MNNLEYFIDKYCSIFTSPHSRDLYRENPKNYPDIVFKYFIGKVLSVDEEGVLIERITKGMRTWVNRNHIVAIAEEEILDPKNPNDAKLIQEMKNVIERKTVPAPSSVPTQQAFGGAMLNPSALAQLAEDVKSKFGAS